MRESSISKVVSLAPQQDFGKAARMLDLIALMVVPVAMAACAVLNVNATAGLILLVVLLSLGLMLSSYERSRPALRQLMPTVVLGATAAAGRILFAPIPDVKPVSAIAIVAGVALGRRSGFMVGALAALVSNMFFGQGAWTPWQMYAWGLLGYLAGVLAGPFERHQTLLYVFGLASGLLYGLVLNGWHVLGFVRPFTWPATIAVLAASLPFDVAHGAATVGFLALIWAPWRRSIQRIVSKYNLQTDEEHHA